MWSISLSLAAISEGLSPVHAMQLFRMAHNQYVIMNRVIVQDLHGWHKLESGLGLFTSERKALF